MPSKIETLIHTVSQRNRQWLRRWGEHLIRALFKGDFRVTPQGIIVFDDKCLRGEYFFPTHRGSREMEFHPNLIVDQAEAKTLAVMFLSDAKITSWYLSLFSGSTPPTGTLTAANVAATLGEITSTTEGFTNATRPVWTPGAVTAGVINNDAAMATFNVAATTTVDVNGAFMVSSDVRGGTSGTLWSAGLFARTKTLDDGEAFKLGYQTSLTG